MTELLTAAQMRAIEQAAIATGEVTGLELMERAGRGVVEAILEWRPEFACPREDGQAHRAVVLCGPGNNGGDGFVVARLLHARGWTVTVWLFGRSPDDLDALSPDAAVNARRWAALSAIDAVPEALESLPPCDLVVDALFGTGLTRPLPAALETLSEVLSIQEAEGAFGVVAIDVPSGICADSGRAIGNDVISATLIVTFHRRKLAHALLEDGLAERLVVVDIGLDALGQAPVCDTDTVRAVDPVARGDHIDLLKSLIDHKYDHGHALVLSGGVGRGGAARLAARAALRAGTGLVTVGCPPAALIENACRLDAIMVRSVDGAGGLAGLDVWAKVDAVALGMGFGAGERCREMVAAVLGAERRGVVLDADALTSFEEDPAALFAMLHEECALTPHPGEFRRLFPDIAERLAAPVTRGPAYSKVDAVREAAARAGCTVLLKGADTVIASADGRCAINAAMYGRAAPWLATAGSGDVLAGMIAGLLARGFGPFEAASTAAWLHVEAARRFGPGLVAEDLPEMLPGVFRDLGL